MSIVEEVGLERRLFMRGTPQLDGPLAGKREHGAQGD